MPPANRELHVVAGVVIFPTHSGSRVNLQRVGKTLRAKAAVRKKNASNLRPIFPCFLSVFARVFDLAPDVGFQRSWYRRKACAALFFKVLSLQEAELGFARYGSANRGRRSVFGVLEDIFPIGIPARPGKILTIREFHVVHVQALHRGELRFARYDLANRGRWNVPHAKGSFSDRDSGLTGGALDDPKPFLPLPLILTPFLPLPLTLTLTLIGLDLWRSRSHSRTPVSHVQALPRSHGQALPRSHLHGSTSTAPPSLTPMISRSYGLTSTISHSYGLTESRSHLHGSTSTTPPSSHFQEWLCSSPTWKKRKEEDKPMDQHLLEMDSKATELRLEGIEIPDGCGVDEQSA
uniref:Uncharacterized protein n=1 Tax=Fagus sylvatica TaxID=28930 RepID=A0A2N9IGV6_FAGSY